jgi:hypothetical protein
MARNEDDFRIRPGNVRGRGGGQITGRRIGAALGRPTSFVGGPSGDSARWWQSEPGPRLREERRQIQRAGRLQRR